jgi:hypothetical protein
MSPTGNFLTSFPSIKKNVLLVLKQQKKGLELTSVGVVVWKEGKRKGEGGSDEWRYYFHLVRGGWY